MQTPILKGIAEEIWNLFKIFISLILHTTNVSYTCFHLVWHSGTKITKPISWWNYITFSPCQFLKNVYDHDSDYIKKYISEGKKS